MKLRKERFETLGGLPISQIPTSDDIGRVDEIPGQPPYTRGVHETMYRSRYWTMRQYAGFGSAVETNLRFRTLLNRGQSGLSVAFDLPTQLGMDSDDGRESTQDERALSCVNRTACAAVLSRALLWPDETLAQALGFTSRFLTALAQLCCGVVESVPPAVLLEQQ